MSITRYESVDVNNLTFSKDAFGEYTTTITKKFTSTPLVKSVKNSLAITERYRIYQDLITFTFNYTAFTKDIMNNQNLYSMTWSGFDWRITDAIESNDRLSIMFMCYHVDPKTEV